MQNLGNTIMEERRLLGTTELTMGRSTLTIFRLPLQVCFVGIALGSADHSWGRPYSADSQTGNIVRAEGSARHNYKSKLHCLLPLAPTPVCRPRNGVELFGAAEWP